MKALVFTSTIFLLISFTSTAQWIQQISGTTQGLYTVQFLNQNLGWTAGKDGTILKTTDGGENWISQSITSDDNIRSIFFTDSLNGWIAMYEWTPFRHGSVYHSTDGGNTWYIQLSTYDFALLSLFFIDNSRGWVVGTNGIAYKTTNGGNTWQEMYINTYDGWLYSVRFINSNYGWAAGDISGHIAKTTNGGSSWFMQNLPTYNYLIDVYFIDQNFGWGVGQTGTIVKTTNSGSNWSLQPSGVTYELRDVQFANQQRGWAAGFGGVIVYSTNSGLSWSTQNSNTTDDLYALSFIDDATGWAVGNNGIILKYSYNINFIQVLDPNGGEVIIAGSMYYILWNSQNIIDVKIEYSTDNGVSWLSVVDSMTSTGIYEWIVPQELTSQGRIKISDLSNQNIFDISDGPFTVQSSKVINVIKPNGGEILEGGNSYEINWSSNDVEDVKIEYSINNGASWDIVIESTQKTGAYLWNVPNILSTQGRVKISDVTTPSIYDVSDNTFHINYTVDVNDPKYSYDYKLYQNYPNPFNPTTSIEYSVAENAYVTINIYDVLGNIISTLVAEDKVAGHYRVEFDATEIPSGIYFYKVITSEFSATKKMILLK